jgi:hypothetical protein
MIPSLCIKSEHRWGRRQNHISRNPSPLVLGVYGREFHIPGEPQAFKRPDDPVAQVDLPPPETVTGRSREGVMSVVPPLAHRQDSEHGVIAALVVAPVGPQAPQVAGRIGAPSRMMDEEDANQATPNQPRPHARPGFCNKSTEDCRQQQAESDPRREQRTRKSEGSASIQI